MAGLGEKIKETVHGVKDKLTHKDEKHAHKAAEEGHKDAAKGGIKSAKDDLVEAGVHTRDQLGAKTDKNKAELGEKMGKDREAAEATATKQEKKAAENVHEGAAKDKLSDAWDNVKGGKDHAKDAAGHKADKNKLEGQEKVDHARAKTSSGATESAQ